MRGPRRIGHARLGGGIILWRVFVFLVKAWVFLLCAIIIAGVAALLVSRGIAS